MSRYAFLWKNSHQLFYMLGNIDSYIRYAHIPFNDAKEVFQVSHGSVMHCYLGTEDLERHAEEGVLFLDREKSKQYIEEALGQCKNHKEFFRQIDMLEVRSASNENLLQYWQELMHNYAHSVAYFRSTQEQASRAIVIRVREIFSEEEADLLMLSPDLDEINKEEVAWEEFMKSGFDDERAMEHLRSFPWLFQNSLQYSETIDELRQRASGHISRDIQKEKDELRERQEIILENHQEFLLEVATFHELALLRPEVKGCWAATGFYAKKSLDEIAGRFSIDIHTLTFFYRSEDIDLLLSSGKILSEEECEKRKMATAYIIENGSLKSVVGEEALSLEEKVLGKRDLQSVDELRGQCARKGLVTGKIRILRINDPEATKEFRENFDNEVLVTSMTQPNVVDIARKAKAIITDEGGMLCHAAIISREFGIPCIVGTHIATEVLHDGDLVEVDADNGIITILK